MNTHMRPGNSLFFFCLFILLLGSSACQFAAKEQDWKSQAPSDSQILAAQNAWNNYLVRSSFSSKDPGIFFINTTFRYATPESSARFQAFIWGNGNSAAPYPIRLDLFVGLGNVAVKILEDKNSFSAYVPSKKSAYTIPQSDQALLRFGVPLPFSLNDLIMFLTGNGRHILLPEHTASSTSRPEQYVKTADGFLFFVPTAKLPGYLELSPVGTPISWREPTENGWTMTFESESKTPLQPYKIRLTHPEGYNALLAVKEVKRQLSPFSQEQMSLKIPPGTQQKGAPEQTTF